MAMAPPPDSSQMYSKYKFPTTPRGGWFSSGDLRFALVIATFYRMMLTHPVKFSLFHFRWHAVRHKPFWKGMFWTITYPVYPIYLYLRILGKSFLDLYCAGSSAGSRPSGKADNASVFFALPPTLFSRVHAEVYFELSYRVGNFMQLGANPVAIQQSDRDVITTKEYWFGLLDSVGASRPRQLARWDGGHVSEVGPGLDTGKKDLVCKISDSYIGIGDKVFKRHMDFDIGDKSECSSAALLTAQLAKEPLYKGAVALMTELIAPVQKEVVRLSNGNFSNVHSFDILTVRDARGDIQVLSCLLWTDCPSWTTHTCTSGYAVDIGTGEIYAPVPWYSYAFAQREDALKKSSLIGTVVPGIHELLGYAVAAHAASDLPWLTSVGWDAMLTDHGFVFFEGNLGCGRLPRRIFFDMQSVDIWLNEFGINPHTHVGPAHTKKPAVTPPVTDGSESSVSNGG